MNHIPATWQPIETAPKDGSEVLLYEPDGLFGDFRIEAFDLRGEKQSGRGWPRRATHWMPFPPPPEPQP